MALDKRVSGMTIQSLLMCGRCRGTKRSRGITVQWLVPRHRRWSFHSGGPQMTPCSSYTTPTPLYGLWLKAVPYLGNRVPFVTKPVSQSLGLGARVQPLMLGVRGESLRGLGAQVVSSGSNSSVCVDCEAGVRSREAGVTRQTPRCLRHRDDQLSLKNREREKDKTRDDRTNNEQPEFQHHSDMYHIPED